MQSKPSILFRADGNSQLGLGHIHRSIALAECLVSDFDCTLAIRAPLVGVRTLVSSFGLSLLELPDDRSYDDEVNEVASLASSHRMVVLDGYSFGINYQ